MSTGLEEVFKGLRCLQEAVLDSGEKGKSLEGGADKEGRGDLARL